MCLVGVFACLCSDHFPKRDWVNRRQQQGIKNVNFYISIGQNCWWQHCGTDSEVTLAVPINKHTLWQSVRTVSSELKALCFFGVVFQTVETLYHSAVWEDCFRSHVVTGHLHTQVRKLRSFVSSCSIIHDSDCLKPLKSLSSLVFWPQSSQNPPTLCFVICSLGGYYPSCHGTSFHFLGVLVRLIQQWAERCS